MNKIDAEELYQWLIQQADSDAEDSEYSRASALRHAANKVAQMSATVSLEKQIRDDAKWVQHLKVQREMREKKYRGWEADM